MGGSNELDVVIIGAGPGGVQLALTLGEIKRRTGADFSYRILERTDAPGAFFTRFPVHGKLISNNKLYTGRDPKSRYSERYDWNSLITDDRAVLTRDFSREFFPRREVIPAMLANLCERYAVPVTYNVGVTRVARRGDGAFLVETDKEPVIARYVVVATGLNPWTAPIPGVELTTPYAAMKPREHYRDKRVLIIGKGNSGFECAKDVLNEASIIMLASPSPTRLAYQTHYVGSVRHPNCLLVENYQLKHQAALLNCHIRQVARCNSGYQATVAYTNADNEVETLDFDDIITATGFTGDLDTVGDLGLPRVHGKFPDIDGMFQSRAVPGLFFAGALTHGPDYRSFSSSGFIHGFRYNSMILAHHLADIVGATELQPRIAADDLADHLLGDFEEDAGMYLQPGHIGRCYRRVGNGTWIDLGHRTRQWFQDHSLAGGDTLLLATLEYGDIHSFPNTLQIPRHPGDPDKSAHIHPVVRLRGPDGPKELNLEENLLNRYVHIPANRLRLEPVCSGMAV